MDWKKPPAVATTAALVAAIGAPALTHGKICDVDPPYRNVSCDTPNLVVVSTSAAAYDGELLSVAENVTGELRQAPTPVTKYRSIDAATKS